MNWTWNIRLPSFPDSCSSGIYLAACPANTGDRQAVQTITAQNAARNSGCPRKASRPSGTAAVNSPQQSTTPPKIWNSAVAIFSTSKMQIVPPAPDSLASCWIWLYMS